MTRPFLLRDLGAYLYPTYRIRLTLLVSLAVFCVVPGAFLFYLPLDVRLAYAYVLSAIIAASFYCQLTAFRGVVRVALALLFGGRHARRRYNPPGLQRMARSMGIERRPKVFLTANPWITSALTNALTGTIYLSASLIAKLPLREILATLGHELGHLKLRRRFFLEFLATIAMVVGAALVLAFSTVPIVVQIFEVALLMLLVNVVSWRNEYNADLESAKALGPEGLISVLEWLKAESTTDEGSETHPPLGDRIDRLVKLLEAPS